MDSILHGKHVVLGVSGSIAAFKACALASLLVKAGAIVHPVLTRGGARFITAESLSAICGRPTLLDAFDQADPYEMTHIALAERADAVVIAPASANLIARITAGMADDMLTLLLTVIDAPVLLAPAMNTRMWTHPIVAENIARLERLGFHVVEPGEGRLACGTVGPGKLAEPESIAEALAAHFRSQPGRVQPGPADLQEVSILVTAGPTREPIDAVRFITNRSSGKMGYAVAGAARERGATVTLVSGPTQLNSPSGVDRIVVETAEEMREAVISRLADADVIIAAAAVGDFTVDAAESGKLRRGEGDRELKLKPTVDIAAEVGQNKGHRLLIGFAAEVGDPIASARRKLQTKNLDVVVANDVSEPDSGFDVDTNRVTILFRDGRMENLPLLSKAEVARRIVDIVTKWKREQS